MVFREHESIAVCGGLHRVIHFTIWRSAGYKGIIASLKKLQNINEILPRLDKQEADTLHSMVAKLLWVAQKGRPEIEPEISFLCTRVAKSTVEDKVKLKRVLQLLKHKINYKRVMGENNLTHLCKWVDVVYGVHLYIKIHTSGSISFGYVLVHCRSSKHKLNTKSSTEAKLVGLSDYLPYNIWIWLFMEAHGYETKHNIIFQYNQNPIRIRENGKKSCTGNSGHIDIRYFFVKYRVDSNGMSIIYCSTEHMLADYFTKALQGALFLKFREVMMGWKHIDTLQMGPPSTKECVGNMDKE